MMIDNEKIYKWVMNIVRNLNYFGKYCIYFCIVIVIFLRNVYGK